MLCPIFSSSFRINSAARTVSGAFNFFLLSSKARHASGSISSGKSKAPEGVQCFFSLAFEEEDEDKDKEEDEEEGVGFWLTSVWLSRQPSFDGFFRAGFPPLLPASILICRILSSCTMRLEVMVMPSVWITPAVAFLTGARIQYGNLGFFKDRKYGHAIVLYRQDTGVAVLATWKKGINNIPDEPVVLLGKITWKPRTSMEEVMNLKRAVKKADGNQTPYQVDQMRYYQWKHINDVFSRPLEESYQARVLDNFKWTDWADAKKSIPSPHQRTDTRLKNDFYGKRPVSLE